MSMNKKEFRKNQIQKLQKLSKTWEKKLDELNLYKELFKTTEWEKTDNVAITLSEDFELDTFPIISTAQQQNKKVLVPKTLPNRMMEFVELTPDVKIVRTKFGVLEPESENYVNKENIDLIIVPGLAFAENGARLGFGGGFYDKYLSDYRGNKVALVDRSRYFQEPQWDVDSFDIYITNQIRI
ncbi:5-formyltetrahydrofolate cyclo-ligase [Ligilactobacillus salivarius]|uniref:5-formyltetrahydrofolate cyclo-ligase n=1 Tax=Ligilactobacillus salivarius TaxID=1624 RepID=A0AAW7N7R2_9LACO|nr:5-formyltetrahydrofolate cyclo-ligase [Ligilactobacillus salivarius]MDN4833683.1 5-formyltetrahydrofolate cyclo-ligase [Ligilactobacillus salivarius]